MANHKSAQKCVRQIEKKTAINRAHMSRIKTMTKKVEQAIEAGNKNEALQALQEAQPILMSSVNKKLMHLNTVSRKISRLALSINKLSA